MLLVGSAKATGLYRTLLNEVFRRVRARRRAGDHLQQPQGRAVSGAGDHRHGGGRDSRSAPASRWRLPFALLAGAMVWTLPETKGVG